MTDPRDPCRVMAESLFEYLDGIPPEDLTPEMLADAIRKYTAYPDCIGALEEAQPALSGDKRQRVDNALAKAKGIT